MSDQDIELNQELQTDDALQEVDTLVDDSNLEPKSALEAIESALEYKEESDGTDQLAGDVADHGPDVESKEVEQAQKPEEEPAVSLEELYKEPEDLAPKSSERFKALVEDNKTQRQVARQYEQEAQELRGNMQYMRETFFTDEQSVNDFCQFSEYRRALINGDADKAIEMFRQYGQQLQLMTGRKVDIDPLSSRPDLKQKVEAMEIDEDIALKLARAEEIERQRLFESNRQYEQQQHQEQSEAQFHNQLNQSIAALNDMESFWSRTDIDYQAKKPALVQYAQELTSRNVPPHMWPGLLEAAYKTIQVPISAPKKLLKNQPLRSTGANGGLREPASTLDVVNMALGYDS